MKVRKYTGLAVRILMGLVFIASAVTKYVSIEAVDYFVYEHQIFSWVMTTFFTRALIAAEAVVGVMLLTGIYDRFFKWASIVMLAGFSVYVLLKPSLFGVGSDNCHCFGTVIMLSDTQTLIKNIVLLLLSYFMFWDKGLKGGNRVSKLLVTNRRFATFLVSLLAVIASYGVTPPDVVMYRLQGRSAKINQEKFEVLMQYDSIQNLDIAHGKKIMCMYSTGCKYCKKTAKRFDVMRQRLDIADSTFALVFWGNNENVAKFFATTETRVLPHTLVPPVMFLEATKGRQPVIILMNDGKIEKILKYPNIAENDIKEFLKQ